MKSYFYYSLFFLFLYSLSASGGTVGKQSPIKFFNNFLLEEKELDPSGPPGNSYRIIDLNKLKVVNKFSAIRGKVKKIFHSTDDKEVVAIIINQSDGGSGGWYEWDTLLFSFENDVYIQSFENPIRLEIELNKTYIKSLIVIEEIPSSNSLGDETKIHEFYRLIKPISSDVENQSIITKPNEWKIGDSGLKLKYERLIGKYIWDFLGDDTYRIDLIERIGFNKYIDFRNLITIGFGSHLLLDRFILMYGSKKYEFHDYALIIIDGFTGDSILIKYTPSELDAEIITEIPFNDNFLNLFPFTYDCLKFISDGKNLSIKKEINCS